MKICNRMHSHQPILPIFCRQLRNELNHRVMLKNEKASKLARGGQRVGSKKRVNSPVAGNELKPPFSLAVDVTALYA